MISASITAYSTAVGPSSQARKRRKFKMNDFMVSTHWTTDNTQLKCRSFQSVVQFTNLFLSDVALFKSFSNESCQY